MYTFTHKQEYVGTVIVTREIMHFFLKFKNEHTIT